MLVFGLQEKRMMVSHNLIYLKSIIMSLNILAEKLKRIILKL